ncbi:hypothetical protein KP509_01G046200 [Ceratopteris richardii]|uniref:FAF domain-containing protein n=1 Tax=Ceratopteris richardii TaxID=49495 RepID=A0A8T2VKB4_CERRI|nr:hypothetical protein KP509_01G046200 [Ceratopteris richardii]
MTYMVNQLPQLFEFAAHAEGKDNIELTHHPVQYGNFTRIVREEQRRPASLCCELNGRAEAKVQASASTSCGGVRKARREFPPPLEIHTTRQISSNGGTLPRRTVQRVCLKPIRRDGRLLLIETEKPAITAYMEASRSDGRLQLRLHHPDETFMCETNADAQHVCEDQMMAPLSTKHSVKEEDRSSTQLPLSRRNHKAIICCDIIRNSSIISSPRQVLRIALTVKPPMSLKDQTLIWPRNDRPSSTISVAAIPLSFSKEALMQGTHKARRLHIIRRLRGRQTRLRKCKHALHISGTSIYRVYKSFIGNCRAHATKTNTIKYAERQIRRKWARSGNATKYAETRSRKWRISGKASMRTSLESGVSVRRACTLTIVDAHSSRQNVGATSIVTQMLQACNWISPRNCRTNMLLPEDNCFHGYSPSHANLCRFRPMTILNA